MSKTKIDELLIDVMDLRGKIMIADEIKRADQAKQALLDLLLGLPELQLAKGEYERLSDKSRHKYDTARLIRQAITTAIMGEEEHDE